MFNDSETVTVRFVPQTWIRDQAVEVDTEGATTFEVPVVDATDAEGSWLPDHNYASDVLREHDNAPEWIRDWSGQPASERARTPRRPPCPKPPPTPQSPR